jgi:hypothetical protein
MPAHSHERSLDSQFLLDLRVRELERMGSLLRKAVQQAQAARYRSESRRGTQYEEDVPIQGFGTDPSDVVS